ncbi:DUF1416 domain-containing protein [Actinomycetospora lutea]|uniref:DUF1416 domain-containing protein n=1 Tax=Actinomycetospora lutea TaxID=663604 RepID=UPI00236557F1|nr:DUF1416 domain-containing protein [Actinomycetospora lutea]MDD7940646.1 DUF1416 domain-containing protein [Actinomycetospora lutea]
MCSAPEQTAELPEGTDLSKESVLVGKVTADGSPVGGAYVRLLDRTGEFTAEVVASATGDYRFYAAPGTWTVRALSRSGNGQTEVAVGGPGLFTNEVRVA